MDCAYSFDTDSILETHINSLLESDPELKSKYDALETDEERLDFKEQLISNEIESDTLPHDVSKFLTDAHIEDNPDAFRLWSVEYNEFPDDQILLTEFIPTRESFEVKKTIFGMIGYIYKILEQEYKHDNPEYEVIERFLKKIYQYDPERHYRALDKHVESQFKVEQGKIIGDAQTFVHNPELYKVLVTPPSVEQMRNIFKYKNSFSNEIRELTCQFFLENPGTEAVILPHGVFSNMDEADTFCKKYYDKFVTDPVRVRFRNPTILSDFYKYKQNTLVYAGDDADQVVNSIFEANKREKEMVQKIMEHRSQKQMQKLSPQDLALLKKYESTRKDLMKVPHRTDDQDKELSMTVEKIDNIKQKMIPEGTKPIVVRDLDTKKESVILTEIQ